MKLTVCLFSCVMALGFSAVACAEIYKWVDEDGGTHYSGHKPDTAELSIETITPWTAGQSAPRATVKERDEAFVKRKEEQREQDEKNRQAMADRAQTAHDCEQAKIRVASLQRPRINKVNADGTRSRMPEEWRVEQLAQASEAVQKFCQ